MTSKFVVIFLVIARDWIALQFLVLFFYENREKNEYVMVGNLKLALNLSSHTHLQMKEKKCFQDLSLIFV
jgi:hypothetical protein